MVETHPPCAAWSITAPCDAKIPYDRLHTLLLAAGRRARGGDLRLRAAFPSRNRCGCRGRDQPDRQEGQIVSALKEVVRSVLVNPGRYQWTVQGFGMLRTYLNPERKLRMNVWHSSLAKPDVSTVHDHPWDFRSWIICGSLCNMRYEETWSLGPQFAYSYAQIKCGQGGGMVQPMGDIDLARYAVEIYKAGDTYMQKAEEIHETYYWDGTVTVIERKFKADTEHARVFWRRGGAWIDAEPRVATSEEIQDVTAYALRRLDNEVVGHP
jgi:hypothetical protein